MSSPSKNALETSDDFINFILVLLCDAVRRKNAAATSGLSSARIVRAVRGQALSRFAQWPKNVEGGKSAHLGLAIRWNHKVRVCSCGQTLVSAAATMKMHREDTSEQRRIIYERI